MGPAQSLIDAVDQLIVNFNRRTLDLPDNLFDRKTQFVINGESFESLLSAAPNDPLVLMLSRGPAGYRFTMKALQHAIPDAALERGEVSGDSTKVATTVWLSGGLRGTGERVHVLATVALRLNAAGAVDVAEASLALDQLERIRAARLRP